MDGGVVSTSGIIGVGILVVLTVGLSGVIGFFFFLPKTEHASFFALSSLISFMVVVGLGLWVGHLFSDFLMPFSRGFSPSVFLTIVALLGFSFSIVIKDQIKE